MRKKNRGTHTRHMDLKDRNRFKRIYQQGVVRIDVWFVDQKKRFNTSYDIRCRWCVASFWNVWSVKEYPLLCPKCVRFLRRLEQPEELLRIQSNDYEEIPF